jgi:hypothetical protein
MTGAAQPATIRDLVRALGGPAVVGRELGITAEAVCNWQTRNKVPPAREFAIWRLARIRNLGWLPPSAIDAGWVAPSPASQAQQDEAA